jgi:mono/diheme cytochrome c family protein
VYYARNITPDRETGIGAWTDGEIVRAIREGIRKDNTVLFPIMPVDPLSGLSDDDVLAIVAYLRTLPPVRNQVPAREVSLFAKTLMTVGMIGPMPEHRAPVTAPPRAISVEYGKYVARHAALCSDCHTPRNLMNGDFYYDSLLAGGSFKFGEAPDPVASYAPNITPDSATGIGNWTESEFLTMMRSGLGRDGKVRTRHMPYAFTGLWDSLELRAVYTFIRSLPPVKRTVPPSTYMNDALATDPLVHGRGIFNSYCQPCHGREGKGAPPTNVVLAEVAPSLGDGELKEFVMAGNPDLRMPSFGKTLSQQELDAVVTYVRSWAAPASSR